MWKKKATRRHFWVLGWTTNSITHSRISGNRHNGGHDLQRIVDTKWHHRARNGWQKVVNGTQNSAQNAGPTERLADQGKDGKMTSTNSSNLLRKRQKTRLKAANKSTRHGSTQQKTAEDGFYLRKITLTSEKNARTRRSCSHNRPARYVNGVTLNEEEDFWKPQQLRNQEHVDGWITEQCDRRTLKNNVMGCQQHLVLKVYAKVQPRLEYRPRLKLETLRTTTFDSMQGGKNSGPDWWAEIPTFLFPLVPGCLFWLPRSLTPGFLRCVAQNPRIQVTLNWFREFSTATPVFFLQKLALLIEIRSTAHCHLIVRKCKPCHQRKPHLLWQTLFFVGLWPLHSRL